MSLFFDTLLAQDNDELEKSRPLTFIAEQENSTVMLSQTKENGAYRPVIWYKTSADTDWISYTWDQVITLAHVGEWVQFYNSSNGLSANYGDRVYFSLEGKVAAYGNIRSLVNWRKTYWWGDFNHLFLGETALTRIPYIDPDVSGGGSYYMNNTFQGCTGLTKVHLRNIPLTEASSIYRLFSNCTNLSSIRVDFTSWGRGVPADDTGCATGRWVANVAKTGTFFKPSALPEEYGESRIPNGWTVVNID